MVKIHNSRIENVRKIHGNKIFGDKKIKNKFWKKNFFFRFSDKIFFLKNLEKSVFG